MSIGNIKKGHKVISFCDYKNGFVIHEVDEVLYDGQGAPRMIIGKEFVNINGGFTTKEVTIDHIHISQIFDINEHNRMVDIDEKYSK